MKLAPITKKPNRKDKLRSNKKLSLEEQFQREWNRVQNQQKQNEALRTKVKTLYERVENAIRAEEEALSTALYAKTERLIDFYSRKSLTQWQRHELFEWIRESIDELSSHPFSSHLNIEALITAFTQQLEFMHGHDEPEAGVVNKSDPEAEEHNEDLFEEREQNDSHFANDELDEETLERAFFEQYYQDHVDEQQTPKDAQDIELQQFDQLLKSSSINKMFRKIAAIIHPDKEQIEQLKLEKTAKMAELIEARNNKDISKIFALYATYVGEPPLNFVDGDLATVIQLLSRQLRQLQQQSNEIIHENLMHGAVYERFNSKSNKKIDEKIREHLNAVRRNRANELEFVINTTSLKKLNPVLRERYEENQWPAFMGAIVDGMPF